MFVNAIFPSKWRRWAATPSLDLALCSHFPSDCIVYEFVFVFICERIISTGGQDVCRLAHAVIGRSTLEGGGRPPPWFSLSLKREWDLLCGESHGPISILGNRVGGGGFVAVCTIRRVHSIHSLFTTVILGAEKEREKKNALKQYFTVWSEGGWPAKNL